jgi:hypothetical protein
VVVVILKELPICLQRIPDYCIQRNFKSDNSEHADAGQRVFIRAPVSGAIVDESQEWSCP